ncbi:MAG: glycosyltransferase family 9 protein [Chitinophagaceae bacterium]
MRKDWSDCKNILCIRPDNMGDLLMSSPAIRALKETFESKITVLTSSMAKGISRLIKEIDEVIVYDFPWIKMNDEPETAGFMRAVEDLKSRKFDAAVIFTVYSQNPLPAAMLAYLAQIPYRLAYCRENPYFLLSHWIPEKEPYEYVRHQVRRDLELVAAVGATTTQLSLSLTLPSVTWEEVSAKLVGLGVHINEPWLILHAGVSEQKREYPAHLWIEAGRKLSGINQQVLLTGTSAEKPITDRLKEEIGNQAFSLGGVLNLEEFIVLIHQASLVISVNTGTVHIAAATGTPVIVLYALTNPQHLPWKIIGKVLLFDVPESMRSKNEVLRYVHDHLFFKQDPIASPDDIVNAVLELLDGYRPEMPEMIPLRSPPPLPCR